VVREAIVAQRTFAEAEEITARQQIEDAGCEVIELSDAERQAFQAAVQPVYRETQAAFGGKTVADILAAR
jgi:TRAP-type C4-dicarboxylate transport system substrate-binding protein